MDWIDSFTQFLGPLLAVFGLLGITIAFILLVRCFREHRYRLGLLAACLELLSVIPLALWWMCALKVSGKVDWFTLGLLGYPLAALCFYALFIAGVVCVVLNVQGIRRGETAREESEVQKLARVLRVLVIALFVCNLLSLFFVPGAVAMGGLRGLRAEMLQLMLAYENPWEVCARLLAAFALCWDPKAWASAEPAVVVICLTVSGICTAAILWQGKRVLDTVIKGNPFIGENAVSLRRAAVYCWFISGAAAVRFLLLGPESLFTYNTLFIPVFFIGGLLCMVMSALFRQAAEMKEDQDLTI